MLLCLCDRFKDELLASLPGAIHRLPTVHTTEHDLLATARRVPRPRLAIRRHEAAGMRCYGVHVGAHNAVGRLLPDARHAELAHHSWQFAPCAADGPVGVIGEGRPTVRVAGSRPATLVERFPGVPEPAKGGAGTRMTPLWFGASAKHLGCRPRLSPGGIYGSSRAHACVSLRWRLLRFAHATTHLPGCGG